MSRSDKPLKIYVAALTRRRPEMLDALLASWAAMDLPALCTVDYLIVENDTEMHAPPVVERNRYRFETTGLHYVQEPELGIPFGRNRAAREAIAANADLLLFVDDDEVTAKDWLVRMVEGYRNSDALLLGAPLRAQRPTEKLTYMQNKMYENVEARYKQKEDRAKARATLNSTDRVTIVTNNWLADLSIFKDHDIWFDEKMRFTGGTDSKLYADTRKAGLTTGWVTDAFVYETIPPERLSFCYQYKRARDQSNTNLMRKGKNAAQYIPIMFFGILYKTGLSLILIIYNIFTLGGHLLTLARTIGWISGRIGYFSGKGSNLYKETTGS